MGFSRQEYWSGVPLPSPFNAATLTLLKTSDFPGGLDGKASVYNAGDLASIPGSRRSPGEGNGKLLQYPCLKNPMERGAWWAAVHGGRKESDKAERLHTHTVSFVFLPWLT